MWVEFDRIMSPNLQSWTFIIISPFPLSFVNACSHYEFDIVPVHPPCSFSLIFVPRIDSNLIIFFSIFLQTMRRRFYTEVKHLPWIILTLDYSSNSEFISVNNNCSTHCQFSKIETIWVLKWSIVLVTSSPCNVTCKIKMDTYMQVP